ncbi:hypothetical protein [Butyrivibrio sp. XPD2006]|uniref:hypothetical protein n=1 Tax=Butyrivibrio sp. XPD2006 TaxID=1280668 RepID=UPI0003B36512|nr:hypothetical protein [Butyrivibrio sp. XPD2006]
MNRLMKADLKRIIAKPSMYVLVILLTVFILFKDAADTSAAQMDLYKQLFGNIGLIFLSIPIFLSVYSDEIKSGIMISMIGMGMERRKIVLTKLKDAFLLYCGTYLILFCAALVKNVISGLPISPKQNAFLLLFCLFCVIRGLGIMALASLVLFLTMSAAGGMLVLVLAGAVGSGLLKVVQDRFKLPVYDMSYLGLLDSSFADFQAGNFGITIIPALIYLAIVVAINVATFDRREMDL